jgi:glycosyltransferase involved in cell wall biosynthesis
MGHMPQTAIIIPCYNEANRLRPDDFLEALDHTQGLSFLFVNDGSKDQTQKIIEDIQVLSPQRVNCLALEFNQGKSEAVRKGFLFSRNGNFDYVGFWDADLATPLRTVKPFIEQLETHPAVLMIMGARVRLLGRDIQRLRGRHYLGRIFATWASLILKCDVYDTQCGAKLFRNTELVQQIFLDPFISRWVFDVEIIARLSKLLRSKGQKLEERVIEYPLRQWTDVKGSKLRMIHLLSIGYDLLRISFK